jgi:hypothetical protein
MVIFDFSFGGAKKVPRQNSMKFTEKVANIMLHQW